MTTRRRSRRLRRRTLNRAGHRCEKCGLAAGRIEAHHIKPLWKGGSDSIENMMALCKGCHFGEHYRTKTPAEIEWVKAVAALL